MYSEETMNDNAFVTILGEKFESLSEEELHMHATNDKLVIEMIFEINRNRALMKSWELSPESGVYEFEGRSLYYDMDNVWIESLDENGDTVHEYLDDHNDLVIACYRFIRNEPNLNYPWVSELLDVALRNQNNGFE